MNYIKELKGFKRIKRSSIDKPLSKTDWFKLNFNMKESISITIYKSSKLNDKKGINWIQTIYVFVYF